MSLNDVTIYKGINTLYPNTETDSSPTSSALFLSLLIKKNAKIAKLARAKFDTNPYTLIEDDVVLTILE
jgi:hypothetical protein